LATNKLHQQLKARRIKELADAGKPVVSVDTFEIVPQDYERLMRIAYVEVVGIKPVVTTQAPTPVRSKQNFGPRRAAGEEVGAELAFTDLEARIIETVKVTPDDLGALMQARADRVQRYLLQSGQVGAERMFILAPKPVDPSHQGQSRADLSLQ
jgi:hypothetical protein